MSKKIHIGANGPEPCPARFQCRLKGPDGEPADHYDDMETATKAWQSQLNETFGATQTISSENLDNTLDEVLEYEKSMFKDPNFKGDYMLVNTLDGYILSDDCVVADLSGIEPEDADDAEEIMDAVNSGIPIQDAIGDSRVDPSNPNLYVVEPETGAITSLSGLYAIKTSDELIPEDIFEGNDEIVVDFAEESGFPLFD